MAARRRAPGLHSDCLFPRQPCLPPPPPASGVRARAPGMRLALVNFQPRSRRASPTSPTRMNLRTHLPGWAADSTWVRPCGRDDPLANVYWPTFDCCRFRDIRTRPPLGTPGQMPPDRGAVPRRWCTPRLLRAVLLLSCHEQPRVLGQPPGDGHRLRTADWGHPRVAHRQHRAGAGLRHPDRDDHRPAVAGSFRQATPSRGPHRLIPSRWAQCSTPGRAQNMARQGRHRL